MRLPCEMRRDGWRQTAAEAYDRTFSGSSVPLDLDAYLDRIGYEGALGTDEPTLARMHEAHVGRIPFENLDVVRDLPIRLDGQALEDKLVRQRRGGYCFEHNLLFKAVLDRLGFASQILTARVRFGASGINPRTHMLLKVETSNGAVIADVGFGAEGILRPLPLMPDIMTHVPGAAYRLRHEGHYWVLEGDVGGDAFIDYYAFTLEAYYPVDIELANHFIATHPASPFRRVVTAQLTRADDRRTLRGREFSRRQGGTVETRTIPDAALLATLETEFGLAFPAGTRFGPGSA